MSPDHKQKIAELADKYALDSSAGLVDPPKFYSFVAGAEAALALLAEPQAGHLPRVFLSEYFIRKPHRLQDDSHSIEWERSENFPHEYLSTSEHQALRARDAAEIEKIKAEVDEAYNRKLFSRRKLEAELATERQVRQAAEARMKKLEACLEEISRYPSGTHGSAELARNALAPLREEGAKSKCPPHEWDQGGERCTKCGDKDWMT